MPSKLQAIVQAPAPKNVQELRSFLGLLNYYGKFMVMLLLMALELSFHIPYLMALNAQYSLPLVLYLLVNTTMPSLKKKPYHSFLA